MTLALSLLQAFPQKKAPNDAFLQEVPARGSTMGDDGLVKALSLNFLDESYEFVVHLDPEQPGRCSVYSHQPRLVRKMRKDFPRLESKM